MGGEGGNREDGYLTERKWYCKCYCEWRGEGFKVNDIEDAEGGTEGGIEIWEKGEGDNRAGKREERGREGGREREFMERTQQ